MPRLAHARYFKQSELVVALLSLVPAFGLQAGGSFLGLQEETDSC